MFQTIYVDHQCPAALRSGSLSSTYGLSNIDGSINTFKNEPVPPKIVPRNGSAISITTYIKYITTTSIDYHTIKTTMLPPKHKFNVHQ
jgi:hypothetical protein